MNVRLIDYTNANCYMINNKHYEEKDELDYE